MNFIQDKKNWLIRLFLNRRLWKAWELDVDYLQENNFEVYYKRLQPQEEVLIEILKLPYFPYNTSHVGIITEANDVS